MKKKLLAFVLSVLMALSIPSALVGAYYSLPLDVGNHHSYGGSHRSSGGSTHRSSGGSTHRSSGSSGSGGSIDWSDPSDVFGFIASLVVIAVIITIIITIIIFIAVKGKPKNIINNPQLVPFDYTAQIAEFIRQNDMDFDSEKFLEWSKNLFITLQTAWTQRDWEKIRTFEKEELFEQHNTQLQEYIRLGRINVIENIKIINAYLHKLVIDKNYENLTVSMRVTMNDYIVDDKSGKIITGNRNETFDTIYLLTFIRRKGIKTTIINGSIANICPHCGAPVDSASAGKCEYCGSIIHSGEFNWVLSDLQSVTQEFTNDNRGIIILDENDNNSNGVN